MDARTLVDPGDGHPLGTGVKFLDDYFQLADGFVNVVVENDEVEKVAVGLAQQLAFFQKPLETSIGLKLTPFVTHRASDQS